MQKQVINLIKNVNKKSFFIIEKIKKYRNAQPCVSTHNLVGGGRQLDRLAAWQAVLVHHEPSRRVPARHHENLVARDSLGGGGGGGRERGRG